MTISELIKSLERLLDAAGDLEVKVRDYNGHMVTAQDVGWVPETGSNSEYADIS